MQRTWLPLLLLSIAACGPAADEAAQDDTGAPDPTDEGPRSAPLASLSSGQCPDLSGSGTSTFDSSGDDRQVSIVIPASPEPGMAVNFFFHGVDDASNPDPGADHVSSLDLQSEADATNTVWVVPDAPVQNMYGMMEVYLWDLALETDHDLVLFDDLRTCVANELDVDMDRVSALGFSGGALWTTVIASRRADTLAAAVELSGGSDIEAPGYEVLLAEYVTPAVPVPVLLTSGSPEADVWPNTTYVVVNFAEATDTLQAELAADGSFVVRCQDEGGHDLSRAEWSLAKDWVASAQFGEPSPFEAGGMGSDDDWCAAVPAGR